MSEEAVTSQSAIGKDIAQAKDGGNANVNTNAPVFNITIVPNVSSHQVGIASRSEAKEHRSSGSPPLIWNVPYQRNTFFTGREDILSQLHIELATSKTATLTQPQAINGLGGIGKTQTAIEYAYRYGPEYSAVLWAKAASRGILVSGFVNMADVLDLPLKNEQDQNEIVKAVKRWLQSNTNWLLILDDVEDIDMIEDFLPSSGRGYILLTTRTQALGIAASSIQIKTMDAEEGAMLLLRRVKIIASDALLTLALDIDRTVAQEITKAMDGLPLALDQAGAYIEENQRSLSYYLQLYRKRSAELLNQRGVGQFVSAHPQSVATTFSLSFEKVQQANPAAADLLYLLAFFHPDNIPEEILVKGAFDLGPVLEFIVTDEIALDDALKVLFKYSLVQRDPYNNTLSIHRLVQVVLIDKMQEEAQRIWAERAVQVVHTAFPNPLSKEWLQCQRYLIHVQTCASLINQWNMDFKEAILLLNNAGAYLQRRGQYADARVLYKQAQKILAKQLKPVVGSANVGRLPEWSAVTYNVATLELEEGEYERAKSLFLAALEIQEGLSGPESSHVVPMLVGLAALSHMQNKFDKAESFYKRARTITEKTDGSEDPLAAILNGLAYLYKDQSRYPEAEELYQQALVITQKKLGQDHPETALIFNNLARAYLEQEKYDQAEPLFRRAIEISEGAWGAEHPGVAMSCNHLGDLYRCQGKYDQAEQYLQRALKIEEKVWGAENLKPSSSLNHLGLLSSVQGKYAEAEKFYQRALTIAEKFLGLEHIHVAVVLTNLGLLYKEQRAYAKAESFLHRAYTIFEKLLADIPSHHHLIHCLTYLSDTYIQQSKYDQAKSLLQRARPIITDALKSDAIDSETTALLNKFLAIINVTSKDQPVKRERKSKTSANNNRPRRWLM